MIMHTYPCIDVYQAASGDKVDEGSRGASALISLPNLPSTLYVQDLPYFPFSFLLFTSVSSLKHGS